MRLAGNTDANAGKKRPTPRQDERGAGPRRHGRLGSVVHMGGVSAREARASGVGTLDIGGAEWDEEWRVMVTAARQPPSSGELTPGTLLKRVTVFMLRLEFVLTWS